jgi:hypothetical protein
VLGMLYHRETWLAKRGIMTESRKPLYVSCRAVIDNVDQSDPIGRNIGSQLRLRIVTTRTEAEVDEERMEGGFRKKPDDLYSSLEKLSQMGVIPDTWFLRQLADRFPDHAADLGLMIEVKQGFDKLILGVISHEFCQSELLGRIGHVVRLSMELPEGLRLPIRQMSSIVYSLYRESDYSEVGDLQQSWAEAIVRDSDRRKPR